MVGNRELAVIGVAVWALAEDYLPAGVTLQRVLALALAAAAPYATGVAEHPLTPYAAAGAAVVAVVIYLWTQPAAAPLVRVDLSLGPLPTKRVGTTALTLPGRPGFIQCYNPATLQSLGEVRVTPPAEVRDVVARARLLQKRWAGTTFAERRRVLRMLKAAVLAQQDDIVRISCVDTGKPRVDALFGEVLSTAGKLDWVIQRGEAVLAPEARATNFTSAHKHAHVEYSPMGVVGVIAPWNYPFYNIYNHVASALFAGNAVVVKMSEYAAWSGAKYIEVGRAVLAAAGHDPDLLQLVQGFGETGEALVQSADMIIFTGSPGVGKLVMRGASATLTPVVLELGGKDPFIVCEDADLAVAVPTALRGTFQNSGQNCVGIERVYAYESVAPAFVAAAVAGVRAMRQGPPTDPADPSRYTDADIGCVTAAPQLELIQALVDDAVAKGATLHCGGAPLFRGAPGAAAAAAAGGARGARPAHGRGDATGVPPGDRADLAGGLFYPPTVLSGVTHDMRIANEEVFGPVMAILTVPGDSDDAAVAMANATAYGLGATVFSRRPARGDAIASRLRCGMVGVNAFGLNYLVQDLPFGGVGASGFGRFSGPEGLKACCLVKSVVTDLLPRLSIPTPIPAPLRYPLAPTAAAFTAGLLGVQFAATAAARGAALGSLLAALGGWGAERAVPVGAATAAAAKKVA